MPEQTCVLDGNCSLNCQTRRDVFRAFSEYPGRGTAEQQPTYHLALPAEHGHRQVTHDREVTCQDTKERWVLCKAGIEPDIVTTHDSDASERVAKELGNARLGSFGKVRRRGASQGRERVEIPVCFARVVKECAHRRTSQGGRSVSDLLEENIQVEFRTQKPPDLVDDSQGLTFFS